MSHEYRHIPVMLKEVIEALRVQPGGLYVDATVGEGGHAEAILNVSRPDGRVLGIDADPSAVEAARGRLRGYGEAFTAVTGNYADIAAICIEEGFHPVQGVLLDLGVSSRQLEEAQRGFSFQREGPLDMRFSPEQELSAFEIVNRWPEDMIASGLKSYGEEPRSRQIARAIVANRPIRGTLELARIVQAVTKRGGGRIHPATRTFQALRIMVNQELDNLKKALGQAVTVLASGGRLAVITYHSLEARAVKSSLAEESRGCICPPATPACVCKHEPTIKRVARKAIAPSESEIRANPRSRSAGLRVGERL